MCLCDVILCPALTDTGSRGSFEAHCNEDDPESFASLCLRNPGLNWQFSEPVSTLTVNCSRSTNLPEVAGCFEDSQQGMAKALAGAAKVKKDADIDLSAPQKESLRMHFKLGHINMQHIQWLMRQGKIKCHHSQATSRLHNDELPKCVACLFGEMTRRPTNTATTRQKPTTVGNLEKDKLFPGQCVATDQHVCAEPGRLYTSKARTQRQHCYSGGDVFCDLSSREGS